jgi:pantoate--beta-alanine ligase
LETVTTVSVLRARTRFWRRGNQRIALVPTMGNLHAGHLRLVERARELAERVVVSCFVNPLQFGPNEDLASYPRTLEADQKALETLGVDLFFVPDEREVYPRGPELATRVQVPELGERLCGAFRPGHFTGVATVVAKLFNMVHPDTALFGRKDYQQQLVIRRMVEDLDWPIDIETVDTVREADGLAMSSRNQYLDERERRLAPQLYQVLQQLVGRVRAGERDFAVLGAAASEQLAGLGFAPEYVEVVDAETLAAPQAEGRPLVVLAAARLGRTRLIDNLAV